MQHGLNSLFGVVTFEQIDEFLTVFDEELDRGLQRRILDFLVSIQQVCTELLVFPENLGQQHSLFLELDSPGRTGFEEVLEALDGEL